LTVWRLFLQVNRCGVASSFFKWRKWRYFIRFFATFCDIKACSRVVADAVFELASLAASSPNPCAAMSECLLASSDGRAAHPASDKARRPVCVASYK
jgi:hypothetical protein